ncbi:hypothetical protein E3N88_40077 [Mikania micrantha]|uniref:Uncharacterized protein n=1 Tax=Mikania micrantha TaxID=192012 RepID=A0A5N6LLJ9_9ASTR|nr:hypothetical protein E3N88_40077 [Mikania micrantha]
MPEPTPGETPQLGKPPDLASVTPRNFQTHRGTRWAPNWAFDVRGPWAGEFEFLRKESRYATTDHLPPSRYATCFGNQMIILIIAGRGGAFWTGVAFRATLKVFKALGEELKVEGTRGEHHHHLGRHRSCSQEYFKLLNLCSSFISAFLSSIEVVLAPFRSFSTCSHTCKPLRPHASPSPPLTRNFDVLDMLLESFYMTMSYDPGHVTPTWTDTTSGNLGVDAEMERRAQMLARERYWGWLPNLLRDWVVGERVPTPRYRGDTSEGPRLPALGMPMERAFAAHVAVTRRELRRDAELSDEVRVLREKNDRLERRSDRLEEQNDRLEEQVETLRLQVSQLMSQHGQIVDVMQEHDGRITENRTDIAET